MFASQNRMHLLDKERGEWMMDSKNDAVEIVKKYEKNNGLNGEVKKNDKKRNNQSLNIQAKQPTTLPLSDDDVDDNVDVVEKVDYRVKNEEPNVEERKRALQFRKLREILMQNVGKNGNYTFMRYTKDLIKRYVSNPYNYQNEIREVSRFLYRTSTLYKKIVLYHATMPLYNYQITQKSNILVDGDYEKSMKEYQKVIKRLNAFNIKKTFTEMMINLIVDGVYYGFVYSFKDDGAFIHRLDPRYCRIIGKNEASQWVYAFDMQYFAVGDNIIFVDPNAGYPDQLWDEVFQEGWKLYNTDKKKNRWQVLPTNRTICALANDESEMFYPQPLFEGIFPQLLDVMDYEQLMADKAVLENYILLVSKIPLIEKSDRVDDFAVSLELVQEMQKLIDDAVPDLVGTAYSPLDVNMIEFRRSNTTDDVDMVANSINNVFTQSGATKLAVAGGDITNQVGLKQAIANDMAITFMLVTRLEDNFSYWIKRNITEHVTFKIHRQTWYNKDEYIQTKKDAATLGGSALDYLTSLDMSPFEAFNQLLFENRSGIKDIMIPLRSSWQTSWESDGDIDANTKSKSGGRYNPKKVSDPTNKGGRPMEDDVSESGEKARKTGRVKKAQ